MKKSDKTFRFTRKASSPKNAIALIYDLEGFSHFFNQPDVQDYVPLFLNHISEAVGICLYGGVAYWDSSTIKPLSFQIVHEKFLGDGGMYIILPSPGERNFNTKELRNFLNHLWNLKTFFSDIVKHSLEEVPVAQVPKKIRFGITRGSVYELKIPGSPKTEYIGFCINLASRLQNYCKELGFIASARLQLPRDFLKDNEYKQVIAIDIKGFPDEIVIVDKDEYEGLPKDIRESLFAEL